MILRFFKSLFKSLVFSIKELMRFFILYIWHNRYTRVKYFRKKGARIGERCSIIPKELGTEPYLVKIGNHVTIAKGVTFLTHDGGVYIFRQEIPDIQVFGPIIIEDFCVIGQNAVLFPNIRIGPNSIVGAGSVVITDVPPNCIVMGVPARVWSSVEKYKKNSIETWKRQKPSDYIVYESIIPETSNKYKKNREKLKRHLSELFRKELG